MSEELKNVLDKFDKVLENYELDKKCGQISIDSICHLFPSEIITIKDYIQQKENIIKEVREWAKKYSCQFTNDDGELVVSEISFNIQARPCDLFKILDKAGNSNERNKDNK